MPMPSPMTQPSATVYGNDRRRRTQTEYGHDTHGNMLNFLNVPPDQYLRWDHRDMIASIDLGGGGFAFYQYDASKQRTRKRVEHGVIEEHIYLGGYELYRKMEAAKVEEIESHHLSRGPQRVLLVDDVLSTDNVRLSTGPFFRYQYSNHLGSACLELRDDTAIISYEEFHPYGTSAYRAVNASLEVPPKTVSIYRMERDEESGLSCHGARYYGGWLGRWLSCDPMLGAAWPNAYAYSNCDPIGRKDPDGRLDVPWEKVAKGALIAVGVIAVIAIASAAAPVVAGGVALGLNLSAEAAGLVVTAAEVGVAGTAEVAVPIGAASVGISAGQLGSKLATTGKLSDDEWEQVGGTAVGLAAVLVLPSFGGRESNKVESAPVPPAPAPPPELPASPVAAPALPAAPPPPAPVPTAEPISSQPVEPLAPSPPNTTSPLAPEGGPPKTQPGVPREATHSGSYFHYTNVPNPHEAFEPGFHSNSSFTVEGDLPPKAAVTRLGLKQTPTHVVEVVESERIIPASPSTVQPHAKGFGGALDFRNPKPLPPGDIKRIIPLDRRGPNRRGSQ